MLIAVILNFILFFISSLFFIFLLMKLLNRPGTPFAQLVDMMRAGQYPGFANGPMDIDGRKVILQYTPQFKRQPSVLKMIAEGDFHAQAAFRREEASDAAGKAIGLSREIQLNDPLFDNVVYVECEDEAFVRRLLDTSAMKEHLKSILRAGATLVLQGHRCMIVKTPYYNDTWSVDERTALGRSLLALMGNIPRLEPGQVSATPLTDQRERGLAFLILALIGIWVGGFALVIFSQKAFFPLFPGLLFRGSLYLSIPVSVAVSFLIYHFRRGTSSGHEYSALLAVAFSLGIVVCGWGLVMHINGADDKSPGIRHDVSVTKKYVSHSRRSSHYHVLLSSWRPDMPVYRMRKDPEALYGRVNVGDRCTVTTASGSLGFEWIKEETCSGGRP